MEALAQDLPGMNQAQGAMILSLRMLGFARKCQGDYRQAAVYFCESLRLSQEINNYHGIYQDLSGMAGIAAHQGQSGRAARLFGAVEQLMETLGHSLDFVEHNEFDRDVALVREALSTEEFFLSWTEGRRMSLEQAIQEMHTIQEAVTSGWSKI